MVDELGDPDLHLVVVPIRDREGEALVIVVGKVRVGDDEWCTKTIWVLSLVVRVIPVGTRLSELWEVSEPFPRSLWNLLAVKL